MIIPKLEVFLLIQEFEHHRKLIGKNSYIIKDLNKKIRKCEESLLNSNYKQVNNFAYTKGMIHYSYKLGEYYIFKYFNSIIVDAMLFFNCINEIKHRTTTNDINSNDDKESGNANQEYSFDYQVLQNYIQELKKKNLKKISKINKKESTMKNHIVEGTTNMKFRKEFLYELCQLHNEFFNNKKNRMVIITKIFNKIINRNKIRQFICENDKKKKKNFLKFFLHLCLGVFIYIYIHKTVKTYYKDVRYFIFINNVVNVRRVYTNNAPYIEKDQMVSFLLYLKEINIHIFQFVYISFFVDLYKYVNLIYHLSLLSLYKYFECILEGIGEDCPIGKNRIKSDEIGDKREFEELMKRIRELTIKNEDNKEYLKELIHDCYLYIFVFFRYIQRIRNEMKASILKIQDFIRKSISLFVQIYLWNKQKGGMHKDEFPKKKLPETNFETSSSSFPNDTEKDPLKFAYKCYIELSTYYKTCVKLNYEMMKYILEFHILLKHFYRFFPILSISDKGCFLFNYYDRAFIYNEKEKGNELINKNTEKEKKKKPFDVFKNVMEYQLDFFFFSRRSNNTREEKIKDLVESNDMENLDFIFKKKVDEEALAMEQQSPITDVFIPDNAINEISFDTIESTHDAFLFFLNKKEDSFFLSLGWNSWTLEEIFQNYKNEKNIEISKQGRTNTRIQKTIFPESTFYQHIENNKKHTKAMDVLKKYCNPGNPFMKKYVEELNKHNKVILDIYNSHIFEVLYKVEEVEPTESDEVIKNRKLLQVKIFLDYEKIYTKRTVATQTQESTFRRDQSIQISKDKEISTVREQIVQTNKITNPVFYLKDIYE